MPTQTKFDMKSFNPDAFGYIVDRIPNLRASELQKSAAVGPDGELRGAFTHDGTVYATLTQKGLLEGDAVNYDGETDIEATSTKTYEQGVFVVGRAQAWTEKDFSDDVSGQDFMQNVAQQVAEHQAYLREKELLSILKGVFAMKGEKNGEFVAAHTHDVTGEGDGLVAAESLNTALQKASGQNKRLFSLVFMHSMVATHLENLKLLNYLVYTDGEGISRQLDVGTWNGRTVIVTDELPVERGYYAAQEGDPGALKVGEGVTLQNVKKGDFYPENVAAGSFVLPGERYTTYALGRGAIRREAVSAKVPFEMSRDPRVSGGVDTLYMRMRDAFRVMGLSYTRQNQKTNSPTDAELADGANWELIHSGEATESERSYYNHKGVAIARLLSRG